jgi:Ca-activated chloride channel family protein
VKLSRYVSVLSLFFVFTHSVLSQTPEQTPPPLIENDGEIIKIESRLVVVPVSVLDSAGQPVLGLKAENFRVLENNKAQEIAEVGDAEKVPLEIAILFDISGTTNPMFEFEQETAAKFLRDVMRPEDRATVFTIGENAALVQARDTAEKSAISIKTIRPTKQYTAFYDTVRAAADYLNNNTPKGRRKVVLIISDGEDTNSIRIAKAIQDGYTSLGKKIDQIDRKSLYEFTVKKRDEANVSERSRVLKSLQNADTVFYSINPAGSSYKLNKISMVGQTNLQMFADQTGGTAFLPKFLPIDVKDTYERASNTRKNTETLEAIFRQLTNELRAQYLLQYYSDGDFPVNKYINLDVGLKNPQNYRVRARQGYFVKTQ